MARGRGESNSNASEVLYGDTGPRSLSVAEEREQAWEDQQALRAEVAARVDEFTAHREQLLIKSEELDTAASSLDLSSEELMEKIAEASDTTIKGLLDDFETYGNHKTGCAAPDKECDCGFDVVQNHIKKISEFWD